METIQSLFDGGARSAGGHATLLLLAFLGLAFATAAVGAALGLPGLGRWYGELRKPRWTPPNWVFGPVWTALYFSVAVAAWLVWLHRPLPAVGWALALFALQIPLHLAWLFLFFTLRRPGLAAAEIVLLWSVILATLLVTLGVSTLAAVLLVPYSAWVGFALALNFSIYLNN